MKTFYARVCLGLLFCSYQRFVRISTSADRGNEKQVPRNDDNFFPSLLTNPWNWWQTVSMSTKHWQYVACPQCAECGDCSGLTFIPVWPCFCPLPSYIAACWNAFQSLICEIWVSSGTKETLGASLHADAAGFEPDGNMLWPTCGGDSGFGN